MKADALYDAAKSCAEELPAAVLTHPFGLDWEVFKVEGKVFMLLTEATNETIAIIKAIPEDGRALREHYADITPGYHMNKRHWITLHAGTTLQESLVRELITESYLLVVEKMAKAKRPVNPASFGRSPR